MSIYLPHKKNRLKTLNDQIFSKKKIALEAIEAQGHHRILKGNQKFLDQLEQDYSRIHTHKRLIEERIKFVQVFAYQQQYFYIDMKTLLFPVRLFIKNVKNKGILFIGYDRQFPGMPQPSQNPTKDNKTFDFKYQITQDCLIQIKEKHKREIPSKIYLTFMADDEIFMFNLKFDHIGIELEVQQALMVDKNKIKRSNTEQEKGIRKISASYTIRQPHKSQLPQLPHLSHAHSIDKLQKFHKKSIKQQSLLYFHQRSGSKGYQEKTKNFLMANTTNLNNFKQEVKKSMKQLKREKSIQRREKAMLNAKIAEEAREKQLKLSIIAARFSKEIEQYQKYYKQQKVDYAKLCYRMLPIFYITIFAQHSNKIYQKRNKVLQGTFKIKYLANNFGRKLLKQYKKNTALMPRFKHRCFMDIFHAVELQSKVLHFQCRSKSASIVYQLFTSLHSGFMLNYALKKATNFRKSVRIIQKRWILRHRTRVETLINFGHRHVEKMIKQYPYLKLAKNSFINGNHCEKICHNYLKDESIKFRHIYGAYRKRMSQIEDFTLQNLNILEYNKEVPEKKRKKYLEIPKKPNPPQQRVFRNLDILKSMLRGWFELEYKKISKKNILG